MANGHHYHKMKVLAFNDFDIKQAKFLANPTMH